MVIFSNNNSELNIIDETIYVQIFNSKGNKI